MKLRSFFNVLGFRSPPTTYGWRVDSIDIGQGEPVRFAQWLHPKCVPTTFDASEIACLRGYLKEGDAVIDVGAHVGDTSVLFALAVGKTGRVFAAEPNRFVLPVLEENARLNPDAAPISVLPYAAVEEDGPLTFNYSDSGFCNGGDLNRTGVLRHGHAYRLDVEGRNILTMLEETDPDALDSVRLIKSDTEGNDRAVMASLAPLIRRTKPYLVCEMYRRMDEEARRALFSLLADELGYRVYMADPWHRMEVRELTASDLMSEEHYDVFCVPA